MSEFIDAVSVVDRFLSAIERGDLATIADVEAEDIAVWYNYEGVIHTREENLQTLAALIAGTSERCYEDTVKTSAGNVVAQQHILAVKLHGSEETIRIPVAIFLTVENGKIVSIREYMDSAALSQNQ